MKNTPDDDTRIFDLVKDHMSATSHVPKPNPYVIAGASQLWIEGQPLKRVDEITQVAISLIFAPSL